VTALADIIHIIDKKKKQTGNDKQSKLKFYSGKIKYHFPDSGSIFALFIGGWISVSLYMFLLGC